MSDDSKSKYFELLTNDFFTLRIEWRICRSFFGTNRETVDLFNDVSGSTTHTLERVLFERVLLGLRKLTDPYEGNRRKTKSVTIKGIGSDLEDSSTELAKLVNDAERAAKFAKNWADKRIAHADLEYRKGTTPIFKASRARVEDAFDAISDVIKFVAEKHFGSSLGTHPMPPLRDETFFLRALYLGLKEMEARKELRAKYLSERNYEKLDALTEEDWKFPSWLERDDPPFF